MAPFPICISFIWHASELIILNGFSCHRYFSHCHSFLPFYSEYRIIPSVQQIVKKVSFAPIKHFSYPLSISSKFFIFYLSIGWLWCLSFKRGFLRIWIDGRTRRGNKQVLRWVLIYWKDIECGLDNPNLGLP